MTRIIFVDTETTGLVHESGDRIIEIGCIEMVNRRLTGRSKHFYVNPQRANSDDALKVHGLTDEFLADKPLFAAVVDEVAEFLNGAEVVIHNAPFDVGFFDAELRRLDRAPFTSWVAKVTDSLTLAREMYPGKANSLDALCRRLEVDNSDRTLHGALLDARLLAEVFIRMTRGQDSLVIDIAQGAIGSSPTGVPIDLSAFQLPVIEPTEAELAAHATVLADLDKASGGRTVWRERMA
ncbi:MAG TPA: DNA polymerase III subunit epsilon [Burkholderiaceae bacterium]|nr:DNA polymerase III subunit epsilon [Burkholderiaceae bacterium]